LIGTNGSGKTTLTRKTLEAYKPITDFFNGQFGYYFGWDPILPFTRFASKIAKKKKKRVFDGLQQHSFSLMKEILIFYNYLEYLSRYLFMIFPKLSRKKLVITDRYFYDIYAQYGYSSNSPISRLLIKMYPKPDYIFILDAELDVLLKRDKDTGLFSDVKRSGKRKVKSINYLTAQKKRYRQLKDMFDGYMIDTQEHIENNIRYIIKKTWARLIG
jgi:thymidylate kinase